MLVIRRRPGESIVFSGGIEVTVLELTAYGAKLGISAPAEVTVLRNEIHLAQEANRQAAETAFGERVSELLAGFRRGPATNTPGSKDFAQSHPE
ncbi:MAG TPA: carbon storage regulator [Bryobacteraceae bacterium]|nr:carbon storage regulator [Bryobacteraceae bacterium]HPT25525.1 carbon storage regulator [Bryobacteraceae bacterium]